MEDRTVVNTQDMTAEEKRRLNEQLDAEIRALSEQIRVRNAPERDALGLARAAQQSVLRFVDEVLNQRGFGFMHAQDVGEVTRLALDALEVVHLLIVCQGVDMDTRGWKRLNERLAELGSSVSWQSEWRQELEAEA